MNKSFWLAKKKVEEAQELLDIAWFDVEDAKEELAKAKKHLRSLVTKSRNKKRRNPEPK